MKSLRERIAEIIAPQAFGVSPQHYGLAPDDPAWRRTLAYGWQQSALEQADAIIAMVVEEQRGNPARPEGRK